MRKHLLSTFFYLVGFILLAHSSFGQNVTTPVYEQRDDFYYSYTLNVTQHEWYVIANEFDFTAFSIGYEGEGTFTSAQVEINDVHFELTRDDHAPVDKYQSNVISLNVSASSLRFYSGDMEGMVTVYLLNSDAYFKKGLENNREFDDPVPCEEPESISQSTWRNGLSSPSYNRSFTDVKHVIIHHSAGSNTNTNYTQVVRDIYLYHTQVNGWSDIGYNYLIAQDGTIFNGRDPDGGEQDNVRGAHFCGKNSGTMGVCLLGNYESEVTPTSESLTSLAKLVSWKLVKESLDPAASGMHQGQSLDVVAGHRDGCSTACPGRNTYDLLSAIKQDIADFMIDCDNDESNEPLIATVHPNPVGTGEILNLSVNDGKSIKQISISDISGRLMAVTELESGINAIRLSTIQFPPGMYLITLITPDEEVYQSRVVLF